MVEKQWRVETTWRLWKLPNTVVHHQKPERGWPGWHRWLAFRTPSLKFQCLMWHEWTCSIPLLEYQVEAFLSTFWEDEQSVFINVSTVGTIWRIPPKAGWNMAGFGPRQLFKLTGWCSNIIKTQLVWYRGRKGHDEIIGEVSRITQSQQVSTSFDAYIYINKIPKGRPLWSLSQGSL